AQTCPTLAQLIEQYEGEALARREDGFYTLVRAIVGQQISVKAADAIWVRLIKKIQPLTPSKIARTRLSTLRALGLSEQKAQYMKNIAVFWLAQGIKEEIQAGGGNLSWQSLSDDEVIDQLTTIKGIGRWTAEMFLIFHLSRPDVLPLQDLGLLKAIDLHYPSKKPRKKSDYLALAEDWRPYRSIATWYLWRALDPVPVAY
ncbi:MAG: DNA-3-methyladenine glycosylase family protein, partial [Alphaproteobacteria bacterium]